MKLQTQRCQTSSWNNHTCAARQIYLLSSKVTDPESIVFCDLRKTCFAREYLCFHKGTKVSEAQVYINTIDEKKRKKGHTTVNWITISCKKKTTHTHKRIMEEAWHVPFSENELKRTSKGWKKKTVNVSWITATATHIPIIISFPERWNRKREAVMQDRSGFIRVVWILDWIKLWVEFIQDVTVNIWSPTEILNLSILFCIFFSDVS